MAMGTTLDAAGYCELGPANGDFPATAINTRAAVYRRRLCVAFGMRLLQTVQAETAIRRSLTLCSGRYPPRCHGRLLAQ